MKSENNVISINVSGSFLRWIPVKRPWKVGRRNARDTTWVFPRVFPGHKIQCYQLVELFPTQLLYGSWETSRCIRILYRNKVKCLHWDELRIKRFAYQRENVGSLQHHLDLLVLYVMRRQDSRSVNRVWKHVKTFSWGLPDNNKLFVCFATHSMLPGSVEGRHHGT